MVKFSGDRISPGGKVPKLLLGKLLQELLHDPCGPLRIIHGTQLAQHFVRQLREGNGRVEAAVPGQAHDDGFRSAFAQLRVPGA